MDTGASTSQPKTTEPFKGKVNNPQPPPPQPNVWVMGKSTPGWYCAKWTWDQKYANHLKALGYEVRMSVEKPVD